MIIFLMKVLPISEHHTGTVNGVNADKHGEKNYLLGGIGQGNVF